MALATATAAERIKHAALELGFDAAGIARVGPDDGAERYAAWLDAGFHGEMAWMATARHRERRENPALVLPGLGSVVCVALCHDPALDPTRVARLGRIARYAGGEDYHRVMRDLLGALERRIQMEVPGARTLGYADTGALLERGWAERAGLGWIGKHSGLISRRLGSWMLLGEVLVDRPLDPDPPLAREHCGTCTRCIAACPTGAIVAPYRVDARRCISYLTIELRGPIPRELRASVGEWIFGCDLCQEACPWNRFAPPARMARLHARALDGWSLARFLEMDEAQFRAVFADSPIRRARRDGFLRNVCVALGNRGDAADLTALQRALAADPAPLVRGHAAWAIGVIAGAPPEGTARQAARSALAAAAAADADAFVRDEAGAALACSS